MTSLQIFFTITVCGPLTLMALATFLPQPASRLANACWRHFNMLSAAALASASAGLLAWLFGSVLPYAAPTLTVHVPIAALLEGWLGANPLGLWMAVVVQGLGSVIGGFSARYLEGEPAQRRYIASLAAVLAAVHFLLLAQHWLVLIAGWVAVGAALERLLCFYPDRPFAMLAAHKKRLADRLADVLLLVAAALAWWQVGSGSLQALWQHLLQNGASLPLHLSAVALVLAVILRTALVPVHGWIIQVMEAPTPVSALLHAGVVNLGGYVLIRFAPLLDAAPAARWLLVGFGLTSALLAGLVMLTRISIKVRLAWSTVAQMGFMVLECGAGMYTLAALHLIGHSLYKAHAFLSASSVVQHSKLQMMRGHALPSAASLVLAPAGAVAIVALMQLATGVGTGTGSAFQVWPWWWTGVMALAWAPLLWTAPVQSRTAPSLLWQLLTGVGMVAVLTALALLAHRVPLGATDAPYAAGGRVALIGMAVLYACLVALQLRPQQMAVARRWSYAGFYLDELYTRMALRLWPPQWVPARNAPSAKTTKDNFKGGIS